MFKYLLLLCSLTACGTDDLSDPQLASQTAAIGDQGDTINDFGHSWEVIRVHDSRLERWDGTWEAEAGELVVETESDTVAIHVEAPAGGRVRVFNGSWSAWSSDVTTVALTAPTAGSVIYTLLIETRSATGTIATHGYIRIKKLNSGG